jgi:hypothetical protein
MPRCASSLGKGGLQWLNVGTNPPGAARPLSLRGRCRCGEGFSSLHPLRRRGIFKESGVISFRHSGQAKREHESSRLRNHHQDFRLGFRENDPGAGLPFP